MVRRTNAEVPVMKNVVLLLIMSLLLTAAFAGAMDTVEGPASCKQCGMDRTAFAQSRMLIVYVEGTIVGVCSLHCAAEELHHNKAKQVGSLMVADYTTKKLTDAITATWVVGGKKKGVMTALAKWAFAREDDARRFVEENGGIVNSFEQAMKSATMEVMDQAAEERSAESELLRELK
jgi:nitrous oxide reductase accessory protein NosL